MYRHIFSESSKILNKIKKIIFIILKLRRTSRPKQVQTLQTCFIFNAKLVNYRNDVQKLSWSCYPLSEDVRNVNISNSCTYMTLVLMVMWRFPSSFPTPLAALRRLIILYCFLSYVLFFLVYSILVFNLSPVYSPITFLVFPSSSLLSLVLQIFFWLVNQLTPCFVESGGSMPHSQRSNQPSSSYWLLFLEDPF